MLVPSTDNPYEKLSQAQQLMSAGRPIPAERIALDSLEIFNSTNDLIGQGEANFFLGIFYKSKSGWKNVSREEFINKSISHLSNSAQVFVSAGENIQASKSTFELGQAYRGLDNTEQVCSSYSESLRLFNSNVGSHKTFKINNPKYNSAKELIQAHIDGLCNENV